MEVTEAIRMAGASKDVKRLKNYFLCSCFACIKHAKEDITSWTLLYYNPTTKKVLDCFVNDKFVTIGEETPPLGEVEKADFSRVKISAEEAIDMAAKNFSKSTINVLITLHKKRLVWTINFISGDMMATTFDIDADTGKITREDTTSLIRRL